MQPPSRTTCILPSNRRKICAVSFVVTAAWYSILYILGSLGDTNCTVVDCEPWITVPAWATIIPLLAFPVGWLISLVMSLAALCYSNGICLAGRNSPVRMSPERTS
jgi:hypothetical protein